MIIAMIKGTTRVCGKAQGYLGLPVRDMVIIDKATGEQTPAMDTAWTPTPDELDRLNKGANIIVRCLGTIPVPMMLDVDTELPAEPCEYCGDGKRTGLPGNACENCMNTGLKYPPAS